jgi:hypothetical protein
MLLSWTSIYEAVAFWIIRTSKHHITTSSISTQQSLTKYLQFLAIITTMHLPVIRNIAVPAMAALLLSTPGAQAMPTSVSAVVSGVKSMLPSSLEARGFNGMGPVSLYLAVKDYLKDRNAYDPSVPNKCVLVVSTTDGGHCTTSINCENNDVNFRKVGDWNVCYLNGNQFCKS